VRLRHAERGAHVAQRLGEIREVHRTKDAAGQQRLPGDAHRQQDQHDDGNARQRHQRAVRDPQQQQRHRDVQQK
jgi:hypothetical protein